MNTQQNSEVQLTSTTNPEVSDPDLENAKWAQGNFELLELECVGPFSETYKIIHKETEEFAFLRVSKKHFQYKSKYLSEEYIWRLSSPHPYIVTFFASYPIDDSKYYIFEYLPSGTLRNFIKVHKVLQTKVAEHLIAQIVSAVEFLHRKGIFHREVSNRHILLSADGKAKLANFRHALINKTGIGVHGNLYYEAPEVFSGNIYGRTADWYSVGICLYEMVMGMTPTEYHCMRNLIKFKELDYTGKIVVMLTSSVYIPKIFPKNLKSMLEGLLHKQCEDRFGYQGNTKDLKNHPFFCHVDWGKVEDGLLKVDLPRDKERS